MHTSPSAITLADRCDRAHAYRYVLGLRPKQSTWEEVKDIPRPTAVEAVREWNRIRRPALGTEVHRILESWYKSETLAHSVKSEIDWQSEPGAIALRALRLTPPPATLVSFACEQTVEKDFVHWATGGQLDYELKLFIDLHALDDQGRVRVIDYKTTSDFRWMKTAVELANSDQQGVLYPLQAMRVYGKEKAECTWLYIKTEQPYSARAVSFEQTLSRAKERALPILRRGAELIERQRLQIAPEDLPSNPLACKQYGGCEYHHERGGPCRPTQPTPGQLARVASTRFRERENKIMAFNRSAAIASGAISSPEANNTSESQSATENASEASDLVGAHAVSFTVGEDSREESPKAGRGRGRPRSALANTIAGSVGVSLAFADGSTVPLPESSPLYSRALAVHAALFGGE